MSNNILTSKDCQDAMLLKLINRNLTKTSYHHLLCAIKYGLRACVYPITFPLSFVAVTFYYIGLVITAMIAGLADLCLWFSNVMCLGRDPTSNPIKNIASDFSDTRWHLRCISRDYTIQRLADVLHEENVPESKWPELLRGIPQSEKSRKAVAALKAEEAANT